MTGSPFSFGTKILGGAALVLVALLLLGVLLPSRWEARASAVVKAPPEEVFGWVDGPEGWRRWTFWPDSGLTRTGPETGAGARIEWDDPELGSGSFRIEEAVPHSSVRYTVRVGSGSMRTDGRLSLSAEGPATRILWEESGDLGLNPLMGYWGLFMERAQAAQLERSLERLAELVTERERTR